MGKKNCCFEIFFIAIFTNSIGNSCRNVAKTGIKANLSDLEWVRSNGISTVLLVTGSQAIEQTVRTLITLQNYIMRRMNIT